MNAAAFAKGTSSMKGDDAPFVPEDPLREEIAAPFAQGDSHGELDVSSPEESGSPSKHGAAPPTMNGRHPMMKDRHPAMVDRHPPMTARRPTMKARRPTMKDRPPAVKDRCRR